VLLLAVMLRLYLCQSGVLQQSYAVPHYARMPCHAQSAAQHSPVLSCKALQDVMLLQIDMDKLEGQFDPEDTEEPDEAM